MGKQLLDAVLLITAYLGILLLHEAGHAYVARRQQLRPRHIYIGLMHGRCECDAPSSLKDHAVLAWGGVLAQLAIALPLILLDRFTPLTSILSAGPVVSVFGYFNLLIALFNLIPVPPYDGHIAWKIIPVFFEELESRSRARRTAADLLRRMK
ncbi:MAG TPA: hypothetical protein VGC21_22520 [Telluria sp.]